MTQYTVGIDEVGRGSLAGPVAVVAVATTANSKFQIPNSKNRLRDSKKLTPRQREEWFGYLRDHPKITYSVARVYPRTIERINIARAANLAALRAFERLSKSSKLKAKSSRVYLDGGLYLGNSFSPNLTTSQVVSNCNITTSQVLTLTRGDEKINAIKMASILAKVTRDRYMTRLAKQYPQYGFELHKGYGTKMHRKALKKHGPSEVHRLTFIGFLKNYKPKAK